MASHTTSSDRSVLPGLTAAQSEELQREKQHVAESLLRCWQRLALMSPLEAAAETGLDRAALSTLANASHPEITDIAKQCFNDIAVALSPSMVASTLGDGDADLIEQLRASLATMPGLKF